MQHYNVRPVDHDSLNQVQDLFMQYRVFYRKASDRNRSDEFIASRFRKNQSKIWTVSDGDEVVGFAQVYLEFSSLELRYRWVLNDLFVEPAVRGRLLGYALVDTVVGAARDDNADEIILETEANNSTARKLYEKYGFVAYKNEGEFIHYRLLLSSLEN